MLERLRGEWEVLLDGEPGAPRRDADWWAGYVIGPCDPWLAIAEAAGHYVIARDEGRASADLYQLELRRGRPESRKQATTR